MNQDRTKRKLTAIFSADAVGYSRLMEEDEACLLGNYLIWALAGHTPKLLVGLLGGYLAGRMKKQ